MKRIFIRADGNPVLGSGHIMRCCSIAGALTEKGVDCCFLAADANSAALVQEQGFKAQQLNGIWNDLDQEKDKMAALIQEEHISFLLVDSYYVSEDYLKTLRKYTRTAYLTGMDSFLYPVDILINYHIYAEDLGYRQRYGRDTALVLGCRYAPLRKEFMPQRQYFADRKAIFITTGATDPYYIVPKLLKLLKKTEPGQWEYHVILGKYYKKDALESLMEWRQAPGIFLYQDVKDMAEIMGKCSIAVSAAGSTLYELCACGIPTIVFAFADNQLRPAEAFSRQGIVEYAGDIRENIDNGIERLVQNVWMYAADRELRMEKSKTMKKHIDGRGARRLAEILYRELGRV